MKTFIVAFFLIVISNFLFAQKTMVGIDSRISFTKPNPKVWTLVQDSSPRDGSKGVKMFKRKPIIDSLGRSVEPIIGLIYEEVRDSIDVIEYSIDLLGHKPFNIKRDLLGGFPDYSSDKHSVVFKGEYSRESVAHKVFLCYILHRNIGVEVIADATDGVFSKAESDMRSFVKSVFIKD